MQIRPIRTGADHDLAVARIAELIAAKPDTPEGEELDILATLVDAYEAKHHPVDKPDPIAAIQFRMEQQGLTRKDLEPLIGSRARVSEIMTRRRSLTLAMIRRVRDELGISADVLIGHSQHRRHKRLNAGRLQRTSVAAKTNGERNQKPMML
jgi:HTH-type transcriptional regulator / antitoxin HigA